MSTMLLPSIRGLSIKSLDCLRQFSTANYFNSQFRVVVVGGGSGGLSVASKYVRSLPKGSVAVVEPKDVHYYQPMWTLVGGGIKKLSESGRPMSDVMPKGATWFKDKVVEFEPSSNSIKIAGGKQITYDYLVVALGIQLAYDKVKGLPEALSTEGVCSNYSADHVEKTWKAIQNFSGGNALFTFPNTPIKCPGAPQKIMYLAEDYFRKNGKRDKATVSFHSALGVIFSVPKYAKSLTQICKERNIETNFKRNLVEVRPDKKEAVFQALDTNDLITLNYSMLHVTPPQIPLKVLSPLADASGFVSVDKNTLQHTKYANIFGIGDCTNLPTSRTAAAIAAECGVLFDNLNAVMIKTPPPKSYTGYSSCPLVTGYGKAIMAEFNYDFEPVETFPIDQGKERKSMYWMKATAIPWIYWNLMLKGYWNGPGWFRRLTGRK